MTPFRTTSLFFASGSALLLILATFPAWRLILPGGIPVYAVEMVAALLLVLGALLLPRSPSFRFPRLFVVGSALLLMSVLFGLAAHGNAHGWGIFKSWFLVPLTLILVLVPRIPSHRLNVLLLGWLIAISTIALGAFAGLLTGHITYDGRLAFPFTSPNSLALFLFPAPILLWLFFRESTKNRWLLLGLLGLHVVVLWFTFSYTVWLSLFVATATMLFFPPKQSHRWRNGLFLVIAGILLAASQINNPKIIHWFEAGQHSSLASREAIWQAALLMIRQHPFLGIGAGNFQTIYLEYQRFFPPYPEWAVPEPHNLFLAFWLESGIFGLIGFLMLIFCALRLLTQKNHPQMASLFLSWYGISFLIQGLFDTPFWSLPLAYSFWFALAILLILTNTKDEFDRGHASSDR